MQRHALHGCDAMIELFGDSRRSSTNGAFIPFTDQGAHAALVKRHTAEGYCDQQDHERQYNEDEQLRRQPPPAQACRESASL